MPLNQAEIALVEVLRGQASGIEQSVDTHNAALHQAYRDRQGLVKDYEGVRMQALKREMEARGLTCCTRCWEMTPKDQAVFIFTEGAEEKSCGYEGGDLTIRDFAVLYRACPTCAQKMRDKHGTSGQYNESFRKRTFFNAFSVQMNSGEAIMSRFGDPVRLTSAQRNTLEPLEKMPQHIKEKHMKEFELPPALKPDQAGRIVIGEIESVLV